MISAPQTIEILLQRGMKLHTLHISLDSWVKVDDCDQTLEELDQFEIL
mgnify:CR=1 FL=1